MRHLRIDSEMSRRLGECGMSRHAAVRFRIALRDDMENHYPQFRSSRHPHDQRFFLYPLAIADGPRTHRFFFVIDDTTSPDDLFIVDFLHEVRP